jgi:O-antigen ligase
MQKFLEWWEWSLIFALGVSLALLGIGRLEFFPAGGSISAWSVSRTTFFFWCMLKLLLLIRGGWASTRLSQLKPLMPLFIFFSAVTLSLLPDFRQAGDYRYFLFGCGHAVMLVDLFSSAAHRRWLPVLLGVTPLILVLRGVAHDPSILQFTLLHRFDFPLDHANTAGYFFAMSIPLCVVVAKITAGWRRNLSLLSCAGQMCALILTFSRGAWLGWAASMLYLTIVLKRWKVPAFALLLSAACVLVALPSVQDRLATMIRPRDDLSIRQRWQLLASSVQVGIENPLLGVGYGRGRLKEALRPHLEGTLLEDTPIWHTHNLYVELFAGTGLLGLLAFLWLLVVTLARLALTTLGRDGAEKFLGFALAAAWISAIIAGVGDIPFYHHEPRIFLFTLLGTTHIYCSKNGRTNGLEFHRAVGG